ncbi:MAG: diguanylate cyclase [Candidatus Wenzhouxiangella sp. M2_3B_020]
MRFSTVNVALPICLLVAGLLAGFPAAVPAQDGNALDEVRALLPSDRDAALGRLDELLASGSAVALTPRERARALAMRGGLLRSASRYDAAETDAEAMLALAEDIDDPVLASRALHLAGTIEAERGNLADALDMFQRADERLAGTDAWSARARIQIALGNVHLFTDNAVRAIDYFERASGMAERGSDTSLRITALANKGVALEQTAGPAASLEAHREALALAESIGETSEQGLHNANICARLVALGEHVQAEPHCRRAIDQLERSGSHRHLAGALMTLGTLLSETGAPERALEFFRRSLRLAEDRIPSVERELLRRMADAHAAQGDHADAVERFRQLLALRDELARRERQQLLEELDARYRVEQAQREVEMLELEGRLRDARLKRRTLLLVLAAVTLLFLAAAAVLAWRGYRIQKNLKQELSERNRELESALRTISRLAREDALTGLLTRAVFTAAAGKELARSERRGESAAVVMADIDGFKKINDEHGHAVGDQVLVEVANQFRNGLRSMDFISRWGGEEFVFLLPGTDLEQARGITERLRADFAGSTIETGAGAFRITLTFGIAPLVGDVGDSIRRADEAMYRGKHAGRNRVVVADA